MSRRFQEKNKDLISLDVVSSDKVWDKNKTINGKPTLSKKYDYYGKVEKGSSAFIVQTNRIGEKPKFIEDTCKLPKNAKNKIINLFANKNKRVVYLVKKKKEKK